MWGHKDRGLSLPFVEIVLCAMHAHASGACSQAGAVQTGNLCLTDTQCSAQRLSHVRTSEVARGYRGLKNSVLSNFLEKV